MRALRHAVERAIILSNKPELQASDFQLDEPTVPAASANTTETGSNVQELLSHNGLNLNELEKTAIAEALKKHCYNISKTAKELGLTRAALYRRMEKHEF